MTDEKRLEEIRAKHLSCALVWCEACDLLSHIDAQAKEIERLKMTEALFNEGLRVMPPDMKDLQAELAALREQLDHAATEREEMKRTYDKAVERLERELARAEGIARQRANAISAMDRAKREGGDGD